jgi:AraC family transcriptional regulator, transcriptional activator of pobA
MTRKNDVIPTFYLYGEPHRAVDEHFIHAESLDDRSRPSEWTIRPHAHAELNHIFHIAEGGGAMRVETKMLRFSAPCLLTVPAGVIHGFAWTAESCGSVLTLATAYLDEIVRQDKDFGGMFLEAGILPLGSSENDDVHDRVGRLIRELAWVGRGHVAGTRAEVLGLMVIALRASAAMNVRMAAAPGRHAALVARFRHQVGESFRSREPVEAYASALGVTLRQLREACHHIAQQAPSRIIDQRVLLEAKRTLLYSNLSIAEIADSLGFADAAYFSRFFTLNSGCPPRAFRRDPNAEHSGSPDGATVSGASKIVDVGSIDGSF